MKKTNIKLNKPQKTIWSVYLVFLFILFFVKKLMPVLYPKIIAPEEIKLIAKGYRVSEPWYSLLWSMYLCFAWIPTVILHLIWKDKESK